MTDTAPMHVGKCLLRELVPGYLVLQELAVRRLSIKAKKQGVNPVFTRVRYLSQTLMRPLLEIEIRGVLWLADAITGQLYSIETGECQTSPRMRLEGGAV